MKNSGINLIRERVADPRLRRALHIFLVAYVLMSGVAMVIAANQATRNMLLVAEERRNTTRIENLFRDSHPGAGDSIAHARELEAQIRQTAAVTDSIRDALLRRMNPGHALLRLTAPLPAGVSLLSMQLKTSERTLAFDVCVPADEGAPAPPVGEWMAAWTADEELAREISNLRTGPTQRQKVGANTVYTVKFSGELAHPGD